jgi:energy-coupling factor transporter ATP-binding protein EcfA2
MNDLSDLPPPTSSEATALASILEWSASCPPWQRDALRRLHMAEKLSEADLKELLEISKGSASAIPLSAEHIKDPSLGGAVVTLRRLHSLKNVNALAEGEALPFAKKGMTVIYGDNGAGKSGYARVLKHLCRSRRTQSDTILTNVYQERTSTPTACIDFAVGSQNHKAEWLLGTASDPRLSAVSVFDSVTANVHVDSSNNLAYTPTALAMLGKLADASRALAGNYAAEIASIQARTPAILKDPKCQKFTKVGKLVHALSHKSDLGKLAMLAELSAEENFRLESLNRDLAEDPQVLSQQLTNRNRRIEKGLDALAHLEKMISDEFASSLHKAATDLRLAKEATRIASTGLFSQLPLPDVGGEVWRGLWEAARHYSQEHAYQSRKFPNTAGDAHCPLCQQELGAEAKARFQSFEAFVKGESEKRETAAQRAHDFIMQDIKNSRPSVRKISDSVAWYRHDLGQHELSNKLREATVRGLWRARAIIRLAGKPERSPLPSMPSMPYAELRALNAEHVERIAALTAERNSPERKALLDERDELADRKWLSVVSEDIGQHVDRLKAIYALEQLARQTTTQRISTQTTTLARSHVTEHLETCFKTEAEKLGISPLGVELRQGRTVAGVPQFQIRLRGETKHAAGKVLSEGEHRCVALAAFLAELATTQTHSAIVFDDPVSSLDHSHRQAVAARLAEESLTRQVIVFTHDVAFLLLLEEACKAATTQVSYRLISRGADNPGFCHSSPPSDVIPIDQVLASLRKHLGNVSNLHLRGDTARWRAEVNNFDVELRSAWERAVEDVVKPVLKRLARKVDTTGFIQLTVLTEDDHLEMRKAYGRLSMLLHNQPDGLSEKVPGPDVIETEIDTLENWLFSIRNRQKTVC